MALAAGANPYTQCLKNLTVDGEPFSYFDLSELKDERIAKLPYSIKVLLESALRNCDSFHVRPADVENILDWANKQGAGVEVPFKPSRVILQDFTGVPAVVDFASMRDTVKRLGGDPQRINPKCPADFVIDHSVQVDVARSSGHQSSFAPRGARGSSRQLSRQSVCPICSTVSSQSSAGLCQAAPAFSKSCPFRCPVHQSHAHGNEALVRNQNLEFERNKERFTFLKWGAKAFQNMLIVPPGSGIVHQVNLEYLARVVFKQGDLLYPDSLVGTDSHTTMINGLGILGWGVGGIEAEAVMLGQSISMVLPEVVGYKITGQMNPLVTSTDVVLTITKHLRQLGVVGKFVEFFGPGVAQLSIADRATISNMCPEYGATVGFFPFDKNSLSYLRQTGRSETHIQYIEEYMKANGLFRNFDDAAQDPSFSQVVELDLSSVVSCCSGPKRPHDRVAVSDMKADFNLCLNNKVGFKGYAIPPSQQQTTIPFTFEGQEYTLRHGSIVIAAITSCTNTSNPSVMLGAGLLAKAAVEAGLTVPPYIKTSLSPGSGVVTYYLKESGVLPYLKQLGFDIVGYGCMTCIGNSGPLDDEVAAAIEKGDLVTCGVLSGNRNFEGRIHPLTRANYLASPLLVVAYALAGSVDFDFESEPLGVNGDGKPVFLGDIWPSRDTIQAVEGQYVIPSMFSEVYAKIQTGNDAWNKLQAPEDALYPWDSKSTYIKSPPFFESMEMELNPTRAFSDAYALLNLGDSVTTDHISPAGSIARTSPAARYLGARGLTPREFNSYGARRGNDAVMSRGTFANIRLVNKLVKKVGPTTVHIPSGEEVRKLAKPLFIYLQESRGHGIGTAMAYETRTRLTLPCFYMTLSCTFRRGGKKVGPTTVHIPPGEEMDVFEAAQRYHLENTPVIVLAGKEYGSGSSRDWAAKGPWILGICAVIAESYERIHRSNLVGMGIMPLQFLPGENADSLGLNGRERFSISLPEELQTGQRVMVKVDSGKEFEVIVRFDTEVELTYFNHGGILNYMIRSMVN